MRTPPGTDQPLWKTTAHLSLVYVATAYRWQPYLSQCAACGPCRFLYSLWGPRPLWPERLPVGAVAAIKRLSSCSLDPSSPGVSCRLRTARNG